MSDKEINKPHDLVERKNQGDRTSESTSKDSVISGDRKDHQAMHQEASKAGHTFDTFSDNNHDQSFKAIQPAVDSFGIDFGDGTIETSKGKMAKPQTQEFFEAKAQDAMKAFQNLDQQPKYRPDQVIAANVTNPPVIRSDATLPTSEAPAKETKISQGLPNDFDAHSFYESGEALRPAVEAAGDLGKAIIESGLEAGKQAFENATHPPAGRILPSQKDLDTSNHAKNVMRHLAIIRGEVQPKPDER